MLLLDQFLLLLLPLSLLLLRLFLDLPLHVLILLPRLRGDQMVPRWRYHSPIKLSQCQLLEQIISAFYNTKTDKLKLRF